MLTNPAKKQENFVFSALYDDYAPAFYGEIKKSFTDDALCEQMLITSFSEIWKSLHEFDSSKERLFTWCFKIVRNEISKKKIILIIKELFKCQHIPIRKHIIIR